MENNKLIIFGAGGHAVKVKRIAESENIEVVGYISTEPIGTIINGLPVFGNIDLFLKEEQFREYKLHIGIGENRVREKIFFSIKEFENKLVNIYSSKSIISEDAEIGFGTAVVQNAVVQNAVKIGKCCIIDTGSIVDHDTLIGDFVNISPNAVVCSHINIGNGVFIGAGTTVIDGITIGENTIIGAGSVVVNDIGPNVIAFGNPARVIRTRNVNENVFKK